jgi:hypothetical protein
MKMKDFLIVTVVIVILGAAGGYQYWNSNKKVENVESGLQSFITGKLAGKKKFILAEYAFEKSFLKKKETSFLKLESVAYFLYDVLYFYGVNIPNKWSWNPEISKDGILHLTAPAPILIEYKVKKKNQEILKSAFFIDKVQLIRDSDVEFEADVFNAGKELATDGEIIRICRINLEELFYELFNQYNGEIKGVRINFN